MTTYSFVVPGHLTGSPPPEFYRPWVLRFAKSFQEFPPGFCHRLVLLNTNGGMDDEIRSAFEPIPHDVMDYNGTGYDIGAHQYLAHSLQPEDWLMCFSSYAWFRQKDWMERFIRARTELGDTLYGSTASGQNRLHFRGTGFMCKAKHIQAYSVTVTTKIESFDFESGPDSLTQRMLRQGEIYLVTPTGAHTSGNSLLIPNGFRNGDQSNILTFDKHTDVYDNAGPEERAFLHGLSYGG